MFNWKEIAEKIEVPHHFSSDYDEECIACVFDDFVDELISKNGLDCQNGCTKAVFISDESDKVLKIPFFYRAIYNDGSYFDEELDDWVNDGDNSEYQFYSFKNAGCAGRDNYSIFLDTDNDYCALEAAIYANVEKNTNFAELFAKTELLCEDKNGYPLYLQEKVKTWSEESPTVDERNTATQLQSIFYIDRSWLARAIHHYGEEKITSFLKWAQSSKLVNDLHSGNLGYRENGAPVILDYSGYYE